MRGTKYLFFLIVLLLLTGCAKKQTGTRNAPLPPAPNAVAQNSGCPVDDNPVCGTDGATYSNDCLAEKSGTAVFSNGPCPSPSAPTSEERKYLFWLLQRRIEQKLPSVTVFHKKTISGSCAGCQDLYYRWGSPEVIARVRVADGSVTAADDTTGYDYLTSRQLAPTTFPEAQGSP